MRQSDIEKILRSDTAVPDEKIFGSSTRSTAHVQLSRFKKKLEKDGNTVVHLQCYRLPQCELPEGLKSAAPILFGLATKLNGSTALSIDQLAKEIWCHRGSENDVTNAIYRLRHDWGVYPKSTGYHAITVKIGPVISRST